jgi:hypothetical protein
MIYLWNEKVEGFDEKIGQSKINIISYLIEGSEFIQAIIVCPVGGYAHKAK